MRHGSLPVGVLLAVISYGCGTNVTLDRALEAPIGIFKVGTFGEGQLLSPVSICTDIQGCVYVGDEARASVEKFKPDYSYETEFGEFGQGDSQLVSPVDLSSDGYYIYVVDGRNERIARFDRYGGFSKLVVPAGANSFTSGVPLAVSVSRTGDTYIAETRPDQVLALDQFGRLKSAFGQYGGSSGLDRPTAIAISAPGEIYVCDSGNRRIAIYDSFGGYLREITGFGNPSSVAVDHSGNTFVSDLSDGAVTCFDRTGSKLASIKGFSSPRSLEVSSDTTLLVIDTESRCVAVCRILYR